MSNERGCLELREDELPADNSVECDVVWVERSFLVILSFTSNELAFFVATSSIDCRNPQGMAAITK